MSAPGVTGLEAITKSCSVGCEGLPALGRPGVARPIALRRTSATRARQSARSAILLGPHVAEHRCPAQSQANGPSAAVAYGMELRGQATATAVRCIGIEPLFEQAGGRAVGLGRRIDHRTIRCVAVGRKFGENSVQHAEPAPADGAVLNRLVWSVSRRRVGPPQAVADHEQEPLSTRRSSTGGMPCDSGKNGSIRRIRAFESHSRSPTAAPSAPLNQGLLLQAQLFNRS